MREELRELVSLTRHYLIQEFRIPLEKVRPVTPVIPPPASKARATLPSSPVKAMVPLPPPVLEPETPLPVRGDVFTEIGSFMREKFPHVSLLEPRPFSVLASPEALFWEDVAFEIRRRGGTVRFIKRPEEAKGTLLTPEMDKRAIWKAIR